MYFYLSYILLYFEANNLWNSATLKKLKPIFKVINKLIFKFIGKNKFY